MSHPIKLIVDDDLQRRRVTVLFRLLLVIPHLVWLSVWFVAVFFAVIVNWLVTLIEGAPPQALHDFIARYLRYAIHVSAYLHVLAGPYPRFDGGAGYAIDLEVAPPAPQNRWSVAFRGLLAIPALIIGTVLAGGIGESHSFSRAGGLLVTIAFLAWFTALARRRIPHGMRDAGAYALAYSAQLFAYLYILTDRYPNSDPLAALEGLPAREDPIRLDVDEDLRRSRLTVFFRVLLTIPHLVWLSLWGIVALLAVIANWVATLIAGRSPAALHRFIAAYLRYQTHVTAFVTLTANPFPGFTGAAGSYPVDLVVAEPERQNRWSVAFRGLLALPALLIVEAYTGVLHTVAVLAWFSALARGRMPLGLRNLAALSLRYSQQVNGYLYLLTGSYPYSGPTAAGAPAAPEPTAFLPPDALATPA